MSLRILRVVRGGYQFAWNDNTVFSPLDSCLRRASIELKTDSLRLVHPKDLDAVDIDSMMSDASYQHHSESIALGCVSAVCVWAALAVPSGGRIIFPGLAGWSSWKCADSLRKARGADKLLTMIRRGSCEFVPDK
jgi:hypothetical protein